MLLRTSIIAVLSGLASCAQRDGNNAELEPPLNPQSHPANDNAHAPVHNIHRFKGIISGSGPEGDAAFDQLASMGVRTIISVDGSAPDVERATARGMRYIHIPTTYATITDDQRLIIARAIRDLPGPVFIHCHHGKHRGPAAAAAALVTLGRATAGEAEAYMVTAGTAASYTGLYSCVRDAWVADAATLDSVPDDFPESQRPEGIVAAMVEIDLAAEHLAAIKAAAWRVPAHSPDLVPAAEAGRLVDALRASLEDPEVVDQDLRDRLDVAMRLASALEAAIVAGDAAEVLTERHHALAATCKDCHRLHRD